jgi:hypothetical protein
MCVCMCVRVSNMLRGTGIRLFVTSQASTPLTTHPNHLLLLTHRSQLRTFTAPDPFQA